GVSVVPGQRRQCPGRRADMQAARRPAAGDRAGRGPDADAVRRPAGRASGRHFHGTGRWRAHGALPPPGPAGDPGLEPRPAGRGRELDRVDAETPNLRVALEFAAECGDADAALRIAGPLGRFAYLRGHYQEIREWMDAAVTAGTAAPAALRAQALLGSGRLALLQCDYQPAVRRLEAALRLYRELGDAAGVASALQVLGSVAREQGRYARAMQLHGESLSIAEGAGDRWAVASAHGYLGFASWLQADFERATEECAVALRM